jgi:hypothetical protein
MASYVQKLPIGSRVRAELVDGRSLRGILMSATADEVVLQSRTRVPEPPLQVSLDIIRSVELEHGTSVARSIGVGIASGAGGALGVLLVLAAIFSDD